MFGHDDDHDENSKPDDQPHNDDWQHPGPPPTDDDSDKPGDDQQPKPEEQQPPAHNSPHVDFSISPPTPDAPSAHDAHDDTPASATSNNLIDLKRDALSKLSPLVDHLDQEPDEKFRTLMMMIQASDDQSLVDEAYQTALKIGDEKERAQALLDIVNEINYFTQNPSDQA